MAYLLLINERGLSQDDAWYKWLNLELEKRGHKLLTCNFPDNDDVDEWTAKTREHMKHLDGDAMIIGHGFGVKTALKILENKTRTVAAAFLIAGHLDDDQYDFEKLKTKAQEFFVYAGDDDEVVSPQSTEHLAAMLGESVLHIQEAGHFDKIEEFEDLLIDIISVLDR